MSYTCFCSSAPVLEQLLQGQWWQQRVGTESWVFVLVLFSRTYLLGIFNPPQKKERSLLGIVIWSLPLNIWGQICVPNRPQTTLCSHAVPASLLLVFYMGAKDTFYCLWCCVIFLFCLFYSWVAMMIYLPIREIMLVSIILVGTCSTLYFLLLN